MCIYSVCIYGCLCQSVTCSSNIHIWKKKRRGREETFFVCCALRIIRENKRTKRNQLLNIKQTDWQWTMRKINEHRIDLDCFFILFLEIIDDILKKNTKEQINMKRFVDQTCHEMTMMMMMITLTFLFSICLDDNWISHVEYSTMFLQFFILIFSSFNIIQTIEYGCEYNSTTYPVNKRHKQINNIWFLFI